MKKHLIAVAALATLSGVAAAQSVTMYGIIDQSIWSVDNATQTKQSLKSMESGAWMPSLWGFTGTEDLGGGLKANFKLEGNLNTDNGTAGSLFDRQSWVGLSGGYGEVRAGKQIDALFLQSFVNNVRLSHSNSAAVMGGLWAGSVLGANGGSAGVHTGTVFSPNTVTYITPSLAGLKATFQHQMGEVAGNTSALSANAMLLNYDGIQNLSLSAGTKTTKGGNAAKTASAGVAGYSATTNGDVLTQDLFAAVYKMGKFQFNAQSLRYKTKQALSWTSDTGVSDTAANGTKYTLNEFGVAYSVTPALTAAVNYVDVTLKSNTFKATTDVTSASLKYALSKRTSLWAMGSRIAKVKETTNGVASTATDGFVSPAAPYYLFGGLSNSQKAVNGYGVGVTHSF